MENSPMPKGFISLHEFLPEVLLEIRYASSYNFIGKPINGYTSPLAILSIEAAEGLKLASKYLHKNDLILKVFDAYRPQKALDHIVKWARDVNDTLMKKYFYPGIDKAQLIPDGYIAERSAHTRGSALDLTIVSMNSGCDLDMGTPFDFLGEQANHGSVSISTEQTANRKILKDAMEYAGFAPYDQEWWHYIFIKEPYPDTYFDFPFK